MIKKVSSVICVVLLMSCEKQEVNDTFPNARQLVLFQVEYINYAWGFSHSGFLIDSSGVVSLFKYPGDWHHPDSAGYISISDMEDNIRQLDTITFRINKNVTNQCLEFGVPRVPKVNNNRMNQFVL